MFEGAWQKDSFACIATETPKIQFRAHIWCIRLPNYADLLTRNALGVLQHQMSASGSGAPLPERPASRFRLSKEAEAAATAAMVASAAAAPTSPSGRAMRSAAGMGDSRVPVPEAPTSVYRRGYGTMGWSSDAVRQPHPQRLDRLVAQARGQQPGQQLRGFAAVERQGGPEKRGGGIEVHGLSQSRGGSGRGRDGLEGELHV